MKIKRGSTSVRRLIFIGDSTSSTGAGLEGLTHASSGLVCWYFAGDLTDAVQVTLVTATRGTYTSGGFIAIANMPGWYEIGIPNAALDGGNEVSIQLRGAANMVPVNIHIELDSVDYQDSAAFGLSRIDASISSRSTFAGGAVASVTSPVTVGTNNDKTGYSLSQSFPANFASLGINASGHISRVTLVDTCTTNTDMRGTDNALLAGSYVAPDNASITAIKAKTDSLTFTVAGFLDCNLYRWRGTLPGNLDSNSFVPANVASINGNTTRAATFSTALDNNYFAKLNVTGTLAHTDNASLFKADVSGLATQATLLTGIGYIDTEIGSIKDVTDKLNTALVLDGAVYQFTANALELSPSGGLTAQDVRDAIGLASANLDTQLTTIDTVVDSIKLKTDNLTSNPVDSTDLEVLARQSTVNSIIGLL